jgi:subtilase family serine protease
MSGTRSWLLRSVVALAALLAPVAVGVSAASAASSRADVGSAVRLPASAQDLGSLSPSTALRVTVALEPRNAGQLSSMATAVSTPGSPLFRHYLSVSQFAQRFGATDAQMAALKSALAAAGLHVGNADANHLTLSVSGTAAQVQKAFSVSLVQVRLASGRVAYANTTAPTLPSSVAGAVQGVVGLNNLVQSEPSSAMRFRTAAHGVSKRAASPKIVTGGPQPCSLASSAAATDFGYTADFLASMYGFSSLYGAGDLGAGQTVAIFELEGNFPTDITSFESCYGTSTPVSYTPIDGGAPAANRSNLDGLETELDIETVAELAPAAHIIVYQAPNTGQGLLDEYTAIVSQDLAKTISTSWGECEPSVQMFDPAIVAAESIVYQEAALQGQSVLGASGDAGSAACAQNDPSPSAGDDEVAIQDPTSQPFVTGVGGTALYAVPSGSPVLWSPGQTLDEAVWNDGLGSGGPGASTGGISIFERMPAYQSGASATLGVGTGGSGTPCAAPSGLCREVPDVSALADPNDGYIIFYGGTSASWGDIGGTSGAAPLWAGLIADTNALPACRGLSVGFLNNSLYSIASSSAYATDFHDITLANPYSGFADNDALSGQILDPANGLYPVKTGYSMATGLGSPNVPALAASLCAARSPIFTITLPSPGTQTSLTGKALGLAVHGTDSGGSALSYTATGLPTGLSINPTTGVISGTPTTVQTTTVSISATDAVRNTGALQFTWHVVKLGKPASKSVKLAGLGKGKPKLTFTVDQGKYAPALKSVSVSLPKGLSFDKAKKTLGKGIVVKHNGKKVKFSEKLKHGVLTVTFKTTQTSASLTLNRPTITITKSEALKIKHHKVKKLIVRLTTTDAGHKSVKFTVTLKKLS